MYSNNMQDEKPGSCAEHETKWHTGQDMFLRNLKCYYVMGTRVHVKKYGDYYFILFSKRNLMIEISEKILLLYFYFRICPPNFSYHYTYLYPILFCLNFKSSYPNLFKLIIVAKSIEGCF
jgi:hypothetical protein